MSSKICQKCNSNCIVGINGNCIDSFSAGIDNKVIYEGYVPPESGLSVSGDDNCIDFYYCTNCGQIQGKFPVPMPFQWKDPEEVWDDDEEDHDECDDEGCDCHDGDE